MDKYILHDFPIKFASLALSIDVRISDSVNFLIYC